MLYIYIMWQLVAYAARRSSSFITYTTTIIVLFVFTTIKNKKIKGGAHNGSFYRFNLEKISSFRNLTKRYW